MQNSTSEYRCKRRCLAYVAYSRALSAACATAMDAVATELRAETAAGRRLGQYAGTLDEWWRRLNEARYHAPTTIGSGGAASANSARAQVVKMRAALGVTRGSALRPIDTSEFAAWVDKNCGYWWNDRLISRGNSMREDMLA